MLVFLVLLAFISIAKPASIVYNTSSICTSPQQACNFNDPTIWIGGIIPGVEDSIVVKGGGIKKRIEIFINSAVSVGNITLSNYVLLSVRPNGTLNATIIAWKDPSIIRVDGGRVHAASGLWSESGNNLNNGYLVVKNKGRFILTDSTGVTNATISNNSLVQMVNFKVFGSLEVYNSRLLVRFVDALNITSDGNGTIQSTSLFVGQYARFVGNIKVDYLSSFSSSLIQFFNATASVPDLEVGTLTIDSSTVTLTPSTSLISLNITNSTVTFGNATDDEYKDSSYVKLRGDPGVISFENVILSNATVILLANNINICNLQINNPSMINGSVQVNCGIAFDSSQLIVNGSYTQTNATYMNVSSNSNFANYTFLKVYGKIDILGTDIFKDISAPGMNGTLRLAVSNPGQLSAKVGQVHDPYLAVKFVNVIDIDPEKGHIFLVPTRTKTHTNFLFRDWRYITAAILLTLLAVGTFAIAKYLRRTRELDERLLQDGEKDNRRDSDSEGEDGDEDEEEIDGMGDRRLTRIA